MRLYDFVCVYSVYSRMVGLLSFGMPITGCNVRFSYKNAIKMMRVENVLFYAWKDKHIGIL